MMKSVATHNGLFHADDVFAVAILRLVYKKVRVYRTRDPDLLKTCDIRVDVGGCFDVVQETFDHHQKGGAGQRQNGIPFAACGLVWKTYGEKVCPGCSDAVDKRLIQDIDAHDNGMHTYTVTHASPYTVSDLIETLNPVWNDPHGSYDAAFMQAVDVAEHILAKEIQHATAQMAADKRVREAIRKMENNILVLDAYCPWQEVVIRESDAVYIVFPSATKDWRVRAVPKAVGSFDVRHKLPAVWAAKQHGELASITGVPDALFCHRARFICGAQSKAGALALAQKALEDDHE